jgi:hypothetical protein
MATRKTPTVDEIQPKKFSNADEIDLAIEKLQRHIKEIEAINIVAAELDNTGRIGGSEE